MMKKWVLWAASILFLVVCFLAFAPSDRIETVKRQLLRVIGNPAQECFDFWSHTLHDPYSARVTSSQQTYGDITIKVKAKNAFGAYIDDSFKCDMGSGNVDDLLKKYKNSK